MDHEKPDHPHQAAVHLMKSLKCCRDCYQVSEVDYAELGELQYEKDVLTKELSLLPELEEDKARVRAEINDLEYLIAKVKEENDIAYETGMKQIDQMVADRGLYEREHRESFHMELVAEKDRYGCLNAEAEKLMEHIRYLHRINQQLVYKFCNY